VILAVGFFVLCLTFNTTRESAPECPAKFNVSITIAVPFLYPAAQNRGEHSTGVEQIITRINAMPTFLAQCFQE
jgi:hypothetical protein